ncbi:MAG: O-antigen ligase family protein [Chloroflexaceae bacterium]
MLQHWLDRLEHPETLPALLRRLLAVAIIGVAIAYSVLMGMILARGNARLGLMLILLPLVPIAIGFTSHYFATIVLILPLTALMMRMVNIPVGNASEMPISMVIVLGLGGMWLLRMLTRRRWEIVPTPFNRALLAFMVVCIISMPWGILWADPILNWRIMGNFRVTQTASLLSLLALMWVPFIVARFVDRPWKIWFYLWSFILCGTLMTATQFFSISQRFLADQGLWGLWFVLPLSGLVMIYPGTPWYGRLVGTALLGWHLYLVVIKNSLWVSGWLPTLVGLCGLIFLHSRKLFVILLIAAIPFAVLGPGRSYLEQVTADNVEEGGLGRLEIWERNLKIVYQHWLFGTGPAGYAPYNMTYFREDARSTHNNYFDILAQFGIIGLGLWLWFVISSLWYGWRTVRLAPPGLLRTVAIVATAGWAAAQVSMMLGDWVLPFVYNQGISGFRYAIYNWIFLGLLIVARTLAEQQMQEGGVQAAPAQGG